MSNGFGMFGLPNENILQLAVECSTQAGKGVKIYVAGYARIEAVDEILRYARLLRQFARRHALARRCLIFAEQDGDATRCRDFRTHVLSLQTSGSFVKVFGEEMGQVLDVAWNVCLIRSFKTGLKIIRRLRSRSELPSTNKAANLRIGDRYSFVHFEFVDGYSTLRGFANL